VPASRHAHGNSTLYLLIVTSDGYAKRLALAEVPTRRPNAKGVRVSSEPVVAAMVVGDGSDLLIATRLGKVERVAAVDVPILHRRVLARGRMAKGTRLVDLAGTDTVARVVQCPSAGLGRATRPTTTTNPQGGRMTDVEPDVAAMFRGQLKEWKPQLNMMERHRPDDPLTPWTRRRVERIEASLAQLENGCDPLQVLEDAEKANAPDLQWIRERMPTPEAMANDPVVLAIDQLVREGRDEG
jgi:hypothetical protein